MKKATLIPVAVLALAVLALPSAASADTSSEDTYQMFQLSDGWHVVYWDVTKNEPATVTLWTRYNPQVSTEQVTLESGEQKTYHVITWYLNGDYFESPFAHDIVASLKDENGQTVPDYDSVDHVITTTSNPSVQEVESVLSECGISLYQAEESQTSTSSSSESSTSSTEQTEQSAEQTEQNEYLFLATCDGWDAYFDGKLWPTRDINGDGKDEPTVLWMPVGSELTKEIVPFLIQPKDSKNAVLLAERPFDFKFDVNGQQVDLSNWVSYVKLALPQVHAKDVYLLYVVCGPGPYQPKATVHVGYTDGTQTDVQFTMLDWCIMSVNPKEFVIDVNRGVGLTFPDRITLLGKGYSSYVQPIWVQVYAIKVPVDPSKTLKDLWITMDLSMLKDNTPYYIWMLALTIKRADGTYLLVLGPDRYVEVPQTDKVDLTVLLEDVQENNGSMTFRMKFILDTHDQLFVSDMDEVGVSFYGNENNAPKPLTVVVPSGGTRELAQKILQGLTQSYDPNKGEAVYETGYVVVKITPDELPLMTDIYLHSYEFNEYKDNKGQKLAASVLAVPGLVLAFTSTPIKITGATARLLKYEEKSGKVTLVLDLKVNFTTANSEYIRVNRVLLKVETPESKVPLEIGAVDYSTGKLLGALGNGEAYIQADSKAVSPDSVESVEGEVYYFKSPIDVEIWVQGPTEVIRKEGIVLDVVLSGSYGTQSNEYGVEIQKDVFDQLPYVEKFEFSKDFNTSTGEATITVKIDVYKPSGATAVPQVVGYVGTPDNPQEPITFNQKYATTSLSSNVVEYTITGTCKGDPKMAVITVTLSGKTESGVQYGITDTFVWPADVYVSGIDNVSLTSMGPYATALEVVFTITAYANGNVRILFDGSPQEVWIEQNGKWVGPEWGSFQIQGINKIGQSETLRVKMYVPLADLQRTEKHVLEVDLTSANICGVSVADTKAYCYWDVKVNYPSLNPAQTWADSLYGDVVLAQAMYDEKNGRFLVALNTGSPLEVTATLQYEVEEKGSEWFLQPATKEFTVKADEALLIPPSEEVPVERVGGYAVAWVPYKDVERWLRVSPAVPGFELVEKGSTGPVLNITFTPLFTTDSWCSDGVCVNVYQVQPGGGKKAILIDVWKVEEENGEVKGVQHLTRKLLENCFAPVRVAGNVIVYAEKTEKGVVQACSEVRVGEKGQVSVVPLPGTSSKADVNGDGKPDYVVHAWYTGDTVVFVTASPDDEERYGCWSVEESGQVTGVKLVGPLALVESKNGTEAYWIDEKKGPEPVTDYRQVGGEYVVSVNGAVFELQSLNGVVSVLKPAVSGPGAYLFGDGVAVVTDEKGKILAVGKPGYENVKILGEENARADVLGRWVLVIEGQGTSETIETKFELPGDVTAVDEDHGVIVCKVGGEPEPVLLTVKGYEKPEVSCGALKAFMWHVNGGVLMVQLGGGGSIEKTVIAPVEGEPVGVQTVGNRWILITKDEKGYHAYELTVANGELQGVVETVWTGTLGGETVAVLKDGDLLVVDEKEGKVTEVVQLPSPVESVLSVQGDVILYKAQNGNTVLAEVDLKDRTIVSVKVEVQSEGKELAVFENGEFAVVDLKNGKVVKTGTVEGLKSIVKAGTDYVLCELSSGEYRVITIDGTVEGPTLKGESVDGAPVQVFAVDGESLVVVGNGQVVTEVPGEPLELEEGILVTKAGYVALISSKGVQTFTIGSVKPTTCGPAGKPVNVPTGSATVEASTPPRWYPAPSVIEGDGVVVVCWAEKVKTKNGYVVKPVAVVAEVSDSGLTDVTRFEGPEIHAGVADWATAPITVKNDEVQWLWILPAGDTAAEAYVATLTKGKKGWTLSLEPLTLYGGAPLEISGGDGFPVCAVAPMGHGRYLVAYYDRGTITVQELELTKDEKLGREVWKWVPDSKTGLPWRLKAVEGVTTDVELELTEVETGSGPVYALSVYDKDKKLSEIVILKPSGDVLEIDGTVKVPGGLPIVHPGKLPVPVLTCEGGRLKAYVLNLTVEKTKNGEKHEWTLTGGTVLAEGLPADMTVPGLTTGPYGYEAVVGGDHPKVIVFEVQGDNVAKRFENDVPGHPLYAVTAAEAGDVTIVAGTTDGGVELAAVTVKPPVEHHATQPTVQRRTSTGGSHGPIALPFLPPIRRRRGEARAR